MIRRTRWQKGFGAKAGAVILSAAMAFSSLSVALPGGIASAETGEGSDAKVETSEGTEGAVQEETTEGEAVAAPSDEQSAEGENTENADKTEESEGSEKAGNDAAGETGKAEDAEKSEDADAKKAEDETENEKDAEQADGENTEPEVASTRSFDESKTDVWDFGAADLGDGYNNRLDADTINGFYPAEVAPGSAGVNIPSFSVDDGDFIFNDGGYPTAHRLRSTNESITRYDAKSLTDADGNVYTGYIYSNKGSNADVYVALECKADDIITAIVSSNGTNSDIHFANMNNSDDDVFQTYAGGTPATRMEFYPSESAMYKFYSSNEKLVIGRVYRQHASYGVVSGSVEGFEGTGSFDVVFTNTKNGNKVRGTVADGVFTAELAQGFDYELSLEGADEYVITSDHVVNIDGDTQLNVTVVGIDLAKVTGKISGIEEGDLASFAENAEFTFTPADENSVYVPQLTLTEDGSFDVTLQAGVKYQVEVAGVDDYTLVTEEVSFDKDAEDVVLEFVKKDLVEVVVETKGLDITELAGATFKFVLLDEEKEFEDTKYVYEFIGEDVAAGKVALRKGQYRVIVTGVPEGYAFDEVHSRDVILDDNHITDGVHNVTVPFKSTAAAEKLPYKETVTVGEGKDFETINAALEAIRNMDRDATQRVTVEIQPGDYQEMLVIDTPNVTFKNAVAGASVVPVNSGVSLSKDSVRITGYYGHGYTYYSMGSDCKYDAELLEVNKYNGYASFVNPGSGTTAGSYWNATVVVNAPGFNAYDIIFENSFNQYQSELAAGDVIVKQSGAKEGTVARSSMAAGDVTVQNKAYVERAAAIAMRAAATEAYFNNCAFIGRQDTLYGDPSSTEAYYNCDIYGGTDYIFGGMTAVFAKCDLIFNTSENNNDVGYITAAQQKSASSRGYLMYNCHVTSTEPGVNTASAYASKAGYLGRPWQADTSEVVFFNTVIDATCDQYKSASASLIQPAGWLSSLGGTTKRNVEYGTVEMSGVDNSASRVDWVPVSTEAKTTDGKDIAVSTFLGSWNPFTDNGDDMTIVLPDGSEIPEPTSDEPVPSTSDKLVLDASELDTAAQNTFKDGDVIKAGTDKRFEVIFSSASSVDENTKTFDDGYTGTKRINFRKPASLDFGAIKFTTEYEASVKIWWVAGDAGRAMTILDKSGNPVATTEPGAVKNGLVISTLELPEGGSYYLGGDIGSNYIFRVEVEENKPVVSVFESKELEIGAKADGQSVKAGTDDYFTVLFSSASKVEEKPVTFVDDYSSDRRLSLGKLETTDKNAIKFTTTADNAELKIWWVSNAKPLILMNAAGDTFDVAEAGEKNAQYITTYTIEKAGTYFLGSKGGTDYIFKAQVTEGGKKEVTRKDWDLVDEPVITGVALNEKDPGKIDVTVSAVIGKDGGDALTVVMCNPNRVILDTLKSTAEKNEFTFTFAPEFSGEYFFDASLSREDADVAWESSDSEHIMFTLPLTAPKFKNATNKGNGKLSVKFYSVKEAESYTLYATDKTDEKAAIAKTVITPEELALDTNTEYAYSFVGLTVGNVYELTLFATRGEDTSAESKMEVEITDSEETEWTFAAFGQGVSSSSSDCGYRVNADDSVTVWDLNNKGKIVPASTDGLSFYYTAIPASKNFTFTAKAHIDAWTFTNAQEGFGIMAADRVGVNGNSSVFWNNSYMASGTKVEYFYDSEKGEATKDETGTKVTMKLGLGAQEKAGVTKENLARLEANDTATVTGEFSSNMYPLETSCAANGSGTYNLFGNEKTGAVPGTVQNPITDVTLRIQKNNTGYFVSYIDENGNVISTKKFYETDALEQLDSDFVYVGFFTSRTFKATFSDVEITLIDPEDDAPAEERDQVLVAPNYKFISATSSNTAEYQLVFTANADGVLTITDAEGAKLVEAKEVTENQLVKVETKLTKGDNSFEATFTPNEGFHPEGKEYNVLSSYETAKVSHTVKFATINDSDKVYVSASGKSDADGTKNAPVDIYTAVKYTQPGQTIVLEAGTYKLSSTVKVERGISGTASKPINMVAEGGRAIFDFGGRCAGFIFAGDYWNVSGIDCTKSANTQKGIQVSGSHITLEDVRAYENGNTGIQVSRYLSTDGREDWPSYDLIKNCTSYSNADAGYEDADGYAAKLTVGDGVVFDGCIAYNNADDGWDLFAKVETGSIGQVTIQNCVAFANGYGVDGTNEGNGNGFKMGGSSMSGDHKLINSIAWGNKAKGIDSNSGPNIQVYNSMSFNNGSNNVALYTNDAANTDYYVDGVLSFRTEGTGTSENIKAKGTQDSSKIYGKLNFFWKDGKSANSEGLTIDESWFVSLIAPKADVADPYAVAAAIRGSNGSINLGDFLKLSETGINALASAGIDYKDVVAQLNGGQEAPVDNQVVVIGTGDCNAAVGAMAEFSVNVTGGSGKFAYQWYASPDAGATWHRYNGTFTGSQTDRLYFEVKPHFYKYTFKCMITDKESGEVYYSDVMALVKATVVITVNPEDCSAKVGESVVFSTEASGNVKKYQWYRSKDGGKTWGKVYYTGRATKTMTVPVEKYMNGYLFYCELTDGDGNQYNTEVAKLTIIK